MARRWWRSGYSTKKANERGKSLSLDPLLCPSSPPSFRESSFSALGCIEARPRHPPPPPLGPQLVVFVLLPMWRLAPGGLPARLHDAVLLHPPQRPVQSPGVHGLKPEHPRSTHELVAVGVPLPER